MNIPLTDYHQFITAKLRAFEQKRAMDDPERLRLLATMPDTMLLRKWLLIFSCVGFPITFAVLFLLGIIAPHLPPFISQIFWFLAKSAMGLTFVVFLFAMYLTLQQSDGDSR